MAKKNTVKRAKGTLKSKKHLKSRVKTAVSKKAAPKNAVPKKLISAKAVPRKTSPRRSVITKAPKKAAKISKPRTAFTRQASKILKSKALEELISRVSATEVQPEERRIEESKFNIGVVHNAEVRPSYDIPLEYLKDRAVVLTVDPRFVFTYWEIKSESLRDALSRMGPSSKLTLRFYDVSATGNPETSPSWDIEVFDRLGNWYLRLDYPEQHLCMDVGVKNGHGHFHRIARSNYIKLPRQALAAPGPLKWMIVSPDGQKIVTDVEEYTEADLELLKKILGPYFFDLLMKGQFASIAGSSLEAIFQEISAFRLPMEISSSPSSWSGRP